MHCKVKKGNKRSNESKKRIRNSSCSVRSGDDKRHKPSNDGLSGFDNLSCVSATSIVTRTNYVKPIDSYASTFRSYLSSPVKKVQAFFGF